MKKFICLSCVVLFLTGCAALPLSPGIAAPGYLFADTRGPLAMGSNLSYSKVGKATSKSILGWVSLGDSSIEAASRNGGIKKIHHVDYQIKNILSAYCTYTTIVYGD